MATLTITKEPKGSIVILHLSGDLTLGPGVSALSKAARDVIVTDPPAGLVIDLTGVDRIDSAGMGELVIMNTRAGSRAGMAICSVQSRVRELLRITHLDGVLSLYRDEAAAIAGLVEGRKGK